MPSPSDPKGYYEALDLDPSATAVEVKAAYRAKAKLVHPDHNPSPDAAILFQHVAEAYDVLHDPEKRAAYHAQAEARSQGPSHQAPPEANTEPLTCCRCHKVTAQPRYVVFRQVRSFLIFANRVAIQGVFCRDCADSTAIKASALTWLWGWWSLTGPFHSLHALITNMLGGSMPRGENARVLIYQSRAFLNRGQLDIARSLAEQARPFALPGQQTRQVDGLMRALGGRGRRLRNRWRLWGHAFIVQILPLIALLVMLGLGGVILASRSDADPLQAGVDQRPPREGETRHVAVDILKVREAPGNAAAVVALLDRFASVQVVSVEGDGEWLQIRTPNNVTGYVPARQLFAGGSAPRRRWCAEQRGQVPANGTEILRRTSGRHSLTLHNATGRDAVVKIKTPSGHSLLAVYVAAGQDARMSGIPEGNFRILFATGGDYSRACSSFLKDMQAFLVPVSASFGRGALDGVTLATTGEGAGRSVPAEHFSDDN